MVEQWAERLAVWLKNEVPDHPYSVARLQFGFHLFLNTVLTLLAASILGVLLGSYKETMQVLAAFAMLRMISGGYHFKSAMVCIVVSAGVAALLPHINLSSTNILFLNMINLLLTALFSPSGIENQTRIPPKYYPHLKIVSSLLVASNFIWQPPLLAVTWFPQAVTLLRWPLRMGMKGGEVK